MDKVETSQSSRVAFWASQDERISSPQADASQDGGVLKWTRPSQVGPVSRRGSRLETSPSSSS
eukprot:408624-Prymnesium_polylepis.2